MTGPPLPAPVAAPTSGRLLEIRDRSQTFDIVFGAGMAVISALPFVTDNRWIALASMVLGLTLVIRRMWPLAALAIATAACLFGLVVSETLFLGVVIVPVLVYSMARWAATSRARIALALALIGSILGPLRWFTFSSSATTLLGRTAYIGMGMVACAGIVGGVYLIGRRRKDSLAQRDFRLRAAAEQQRLQLAEQEQRARAATIDERNRIARELHDIVAHSLSVIVVQAEGAKAMARKRPERAPEVLETIADTSREALAEMRRMVGLLRSGTPAEIGPGRTDGPEGSSGRGATNEDYLPTPGLGELAALVHKTTDRAELRVRGEQPAVSQALGLTVYRIVQESLTNVLKHAGPQAHAVVSVGYLPDRIEIEVADDGRGAAAEGDGLGHGLQGMQERVQLHGGQVSAQPRSGGGFVVHAALPVPNDQASARGAFIQDLQAQNLQAHNQQAHNQQAQNQYDASRRGATR